MKSTMFHYLRCIWFDINRHKSDQCFIKLPDGNNSGFILLYINRQHLPQLYTFILCMNWFKMNWLKNLYDKYIIHASDQSQFVIDLGFWRRKKITGEMLLQTDDDFHYATSVSCASFTLWIIVHIAHYGPYMPTLSIPTLRPKTLSL